MAGKVEESKTFRSHGYFLYEVFISFSVLRGAFNFVIPMSQRCSSGGDEQRAAGEVVRQCNSCQDSNMMLRRNRVMIHAVYYPN